MCLVAAFGLFVVLVVETSHLLKLYVRFVYALIILRSLSWLYTVIVFASFKNDFMNFCKASYNQSNADENQITRACNIAYIGWFLSTIFIGVFLIIITIYFAMVINAYAEKCKAKEDGYYISPDVIETPGSNLNS
ncbi:31507_t:CDS:2 [Racocetra persica]|uniref:31507_t:CDS:1 n=1 Tax=Racocetra persica TaxID=160502 RepID=A0ACA9N478_9GLOM|nr:31507_t:CDS:2 [Racocetra persica]